MRKMFDQIPNSQFWKCKKCIPNSVENWYLEHHERVTMHKSELDTLVRNVEYPSPGSRVLAKVWWEVKGFFIGGSA